MNIIFLFKHSLFFQDMKTICCKIIVKMNEYDNSLNHY